MSAVAIIVMRWLLVVTLAVAPAIVLAGDQETEVEARRVVILNATDPYLPAFIAVDTAQREAIRAGSRAPVELYAEALDMHRFPRKLLDQDVVALLRDKYRDLKVDVVVAVAPIAFDFAQRHRAEIWPGAVIVFNSVSAAALEERSLDPRIIGLPVSVELGQTIDLGLRLRPRTRRVAVVAGDDASCCDRVSLAREALERDGGRLDVQYIVGLTLAETVAAVEELPEDALVLYLTMFRDGAGVPHVPRDVLTRIAAVSRAPVFGVFETYLGHGIVAGSIASLGAQGRRAGELVARVLNGEDPAAIGIQAPVESTCIADWRQLRHWGIDADLLPADCEVRFRETTAWDHYRGQILIVLAVILAQAALIIALALSRRRLRHAQTALWDEYGRRTEAEGLAARLRGRLERFSKERSLGAMATSIAHEINQPLIAIQNYAQAARRRLQGDVDETPKLIELVAKIGGQAERAGAITQRVRSLVCTTDLEPVPVDLGPLLDAVIRMMEPEIGSRGCRIVCETLGEPPAVLADPLQVQLVLVNLLQNAMQSTCASGKADEHVSVEVRPLDDREVQVSVTDRGAGVAPDRVADIFEPLYSGTSGGMGMGLAVARSIVEAHGGRLWYEPNPAGGAVFRFTLRAVGS